MHTIKDRRWRFRGAIAAFAVLLTGPYLAGCGGASPPVKDGSETTPTEPSRTPDTTTHTAQVTNEWIDMIDQAGMADYAQLGRDLLAQNRVKIVSPPTLGERFNAFAHINTREVWINTPMFERYPDVLDQATIFLHELIHIHSGEMTHNGPWWSVQNEFRVYYAQLETSVAALDTPPFYDESIGVGP